MLRCVRLPLLGTTLPERSPTTGARTPGRPLVSRTRARLPASMSSEAQLKVVFVTTEVAPWCVQISLLFRACDWAPLKGCWLKEMSCCGAFL